MRDVDKTKEQLIDELAKTKSRLSELEELEARRKQVKESQSLRIGEILLEMEILTKQELEYCLQKQKEMNAYDHGHRTLGEIMVDSGIITEEQLHIGLAEQLQRLHNLLTVYIDEKLLMDAINTIHDYGFSARPSDPEEVISIFRKWRVSEAARERAEKALQDVEEQYRVLVENANEAILVVQGGMFKFVNPEAVKLTGYSKEELSSGSYMDFVYPDDRNIMTEYFDRKLKGENVHSTHSFRIVDRYGRIKWVEINTVFISWGGRPALLNLIYDVTDRKQLEAELIKVQKLESVGILAGGIAHDFNNILTAILGHICLAKVYSDSEKVSEMLEKAENASMQARELTQELLTFSRGGSPLKELADIGEMLRDSAIFALRGSNIRCEFSIPDDLWILEVDPGQINRVITNIVVNAVQASPDDSLIKVSAHNKILGIGSIIPLNPGAYLEISVEDHGMGIPEENLQKIFYPYFTTKKEGTGLGLATSYSIIKNHNGHIMVESEVGMGTTFRIYLPASPEKVSVKEKEREGLNKGNIMVMDDAEVVRETAKDMLNSIGYSVAFAADGIEAVDLYRSARNSGKPFDAVIMDLTINGGMGGRAAVEKLKAMDPEVKAIVSSGYSNDPIMADYEAYGFKGVIAKPYRARELDDVLDRVINGRAILEKI